MSEQIVFLKAGLTQVLFSLFIHRISLGLAFHFSETSVLGRLYQSLVGFSFGCSYFVIVKIVKSLSCGAHSFLSHLFLVEITLQISYGFRMSGFSIFSVLLVFIENHRRSFDFLRGCHI